MANIPPCKPRLQSRPTVSSALWGHLLRKDAPSRSPTSNPATDKQYASVAPVDKTGTSMRILLHDNQVNLEKFSENVGMLTSGVSDTKRELVVVQKLFQQEHETLIGETVNLVNRCQTEIQRSVGEPAQAPKIQELKQDLSLIDRRLEALDRKFDALNMFNQTQSQTLLTLQTQQGKILTALLPLLPLLQAVPLHIDTARSDIKETIHKTTNNILDQQENKILGELAQMLPLLQAGPRHIDATKDALRDAIFESTRETATTLAEISSIVNSNVKKPTPERTITRTLSGSSSQYACPTDSGDDSVQRKRRRLDYDGDGNINITVSSPAANTGPRPADVLVPPSTSSLVNNYAAPPATSFALNRRSLDVPAAPQTPRRVTSTDIPPTLRLRDSAGTYSIHSVSGRYAATPLRRQSLVGLLRPGTNPSDTTRSLYAMPRKASLSTTNVQGPTHIKTSAVPQIYPSGSLGKAIASSPLRPPLAYMHGFSNHVPSSTTTSMSPTLEKSDIGGPLETPGKPISLKDMRSRRESTFRDRGKRYLPLDDDEEEDCTGC